MQERESFVDPVTEFLLALHVDFDMEAVAKNFRFSEQIVVSDYCFAWTYGDFVEQSRLLIFETLSKVYKCLDMRYARSSRGFVGSGVAADPACIQGLYWATCRLMRPPVRSESLRLFACLDWTPRLTRRRIKLCLATTSPQCTSLLLVWSRQSAHHFGCSYQQIIDRTKTLMSRTLAMAQAEKKHMPNFAADNVFEQLMSFLSEIEPFFSLQED